jgi:hypothetical protein
MAFYSRQIWCIFNLHGVSMRLQIRNPIATATSRGWLVYFDDPIGVLAALLSIGLSRGTRSQ